MFDLTAENFLQDDLETAKTRYFEMSNNLQNAERITGHVYTIGKMVELESYMKEIEYFLTLDSSAEKEKYLKELLRDTLRKNPHNSTSGIQNEFNYYGSVGKRKFLELFLVYR